MTALNPTMRVGRPGRGGDADPPHAAGPQVGARGRGRAARPGGPARPGGRPRTPTRTSSPAASASGWCSRWPWPTTRRCWSATSRRPRWTSPCRRMVLDLIVRGVAGAGRRDALHHPRPRGGGDRLRAGDGDVRRPGGRGGSGPRGLHQAAPPLHAGADRAPRTLPWSTSAAGWPPSPGPSRPPGGSPPGVSSGTGARTPTDACAERPPWTPSSADSGYACFHPAPTGRGDPTQLSDPGRDRTDRTGEPGCGDSASAT